jgi:hypothetical protein
VRARLDGGVVPGLGEDSRLFLLAAVFVMSIGSISRTSSQSSAMPQRAPRALFGMACSIREGVGICTRGHTERLERDARFVVFCAAWSRT